MATQRSTAGKLLTYGAWGLIGLLVLLILPAGNALAGSGGDGDTDCDPGVPVRAKVRFSNNTGETANDFHFYVYQNDKPHVVVNGATASSSSFGTVGVGLGTDDGTDSPPPGNHGAQVDMSGGTVPAGGTVTVELMLCMNERNSLKFKDIDWTSDGQSLDQPKPSPAGGWRAKRPFPGGGGGKPGDPGGGGAGAQEGDGGGDGNWVHIICIENDSLTECIYIGELKLLASDFLYSDLDAIDWDAIDPVKNEFGEPPVIIPPGDKWCFNFETTGSYLGGHVYLNYDAEVVDCPGGGAKSIEKGTTGSTPVLTIGDHPNPAASLDLDNDDLWDSWEDVHGLSIDDDGSTDPNNGPLGDPDADGLTNEEEQGLLTDPNDPNDPLTVPPGLTLLGTLFADWNFAPAPIPADFFNPGSDPFDGPIPLGSLQVVDPPCAPLDVPFDTILERIGPTPLPHVGDASPIPIEIVFPDFISSSPITVTFNGGQNPTEYDVLVTIDPDGPPPASQVDLQRTNLTGGTFTVDSFFDIWTEITFTPTEGGDPVVLERQLQLTPTGLSGGPVNWRGIAPELDCPPCMGGLHPGLNGGLQAFYLQDPAAGFQQCVQLPCGFVPPPGTDGVTFGDDALKSENPTSYEFGNGFPPIPADFFGPGSPPFEGRVDFSSAPLLTSPFCPDSAGVADTIVGRFAPADIPNNGDTATVPIEIVSLNLSSVAPIDVGLDHGQWDVQVTLSQQAHSSGTMTITRSHADGGVFDSELYVHPLFTFTRVDESADPLVLDGAASGFGSYVRAENMPWIDDTSGLGPVCAPDFAPGIDAVLPKSVSGEKTPFTYSGGPLTLTLSPADLSGDGDSDGLTDFDEDYQGTDPADPDSDNDGLTDGDEVHTYGTDPLDTDSDNDGDSDKTEIDNGTDPNDPTDVAGIWVDFAHGGTETGALDTPYSSLAGALPNVSPGVTLRIKGDTGDSDTIETPSITDAMTIKAAGGPVRIGAGAAL